jgi:hypothetical protein
MQKALSSAQQAFAMPTADINRHASFSFRSGHRRASTNISSVCVIGVYATEAAVRWFHVRLTHRRVRAARSGVVIRLPWPQPNRERGIVFKIAQAAARDGLASLIAAPRRSQRRQRLQSIAPAATHSSMLRRAESML